MRHEAAGASFQIAEATATPDQYAQTMRAVGRRDLLLALVGLCTGALACASGAGGEVHSDPGALGEWLRYGGAVLLPDLAALRRLGALYLGAHPEEGSRTLLSQLLIVADDGTIPSRLLSAVARDWSNHHVAVVDGWLLARTEARLCALLYLEARP